MSVLLWVAVLVGAWCAASVVAALALGAFLRRRGALAAERFEALRRIDTGPLQMWLAEVPRPRPAGDDAVATRDAPGPRATDLAATVPDTPAELLGDLHA